jgi:hypothetical protein
MNVFIPHKKDFNIYFDEIMNFSSFNYTFGKIEDFRPKFDIVNIQFPEAIFNWEKPSQLQLEELEENIIYWKKSSKIVLLFNDHVSHYDINNEFQNLFKLIHKYSDGVIHLGFFSLNKFKSLFTKKCYQDVIYHPLYQSLTGGFEVVDIKDKFKVELNDKYVVSVIGNVRSIEEVKFIIKAFKKITIKNKILIVPKMYNFLQLPRYLPYRFRRVYKILIEKYYFFPLKRSQYKLGFTYIEYSMIVDLLNKTSLIIIPRLRNLNSGIVFLGLTFNKPMLFTKIGNLTEIGEQFNFPILDLKKRNYKEIITKLTDKKFQNIFETKEYKIKKKQFYPRHVASQYELFFNKVIEL